MRKLNTMLLVGAALAAAAGCAKDQSNTDAQRALNSDLQLAGQARATARLDSVSAVEQANSSRAPQTQTVTRTTTSTAAGPSYRSEKRATSTTTRRSSTASSGSGRAAGSTTTTEQRTVEVKHTGRDAAIGAAAGAAIGAATSSDKLKGGLIGAAAGGILGGVIGNNVDKERKPAPPPPER
ncbi:MAG: hypothetical protein NVS9B3_05560 [Gemmatimonadaceae bacterium]